MARRHARENGGSVTSDEVGLAAVNLEQYIVGNDLSASMVLSADEYQLLRADVNGWTDRQAIAMAMEEFDLDRFWDDGQYDYDDSVIRDDWARETRLFW